MTMGGALLALLWVACGPVDPLPGDPLPEAECADDWGSKADFEDYYVDKVCAWVAECPGAESSAFEQCMAEWSALSVWEDPERCMDDCTASACMDRVRAGPCTEENQDSLCGPWVPFFSCPAGDEAD